MGITGLLPFLENASRTCHISEFRGATIAIDSYCWLHKGATACAMQIARGEETQVYVNYCMRYVKMLQYYNIRPILVFDGKNLPAKADTEAKRREARNKAKQRATELLRLGKSDEARSYLKQSINITPEMASAVIRECHKINVDCIVAPYESDAQLAFFNLKGVAEYVITEDSDLILFGCSKIIFKLDHQGSGSLVEADKIPAAMNIRPDRYTFDKFRYMCILSGCDYIDSLRGIGLKKALKFISLTEETNPEIFLDKIPRYLNMRQLQVTNEYKQNFMVALATFQHQTVFDPFKRKLVPLVDPEITGTNPEFCKNAGDIFDHETAYQVALGNLHPTNFKQLNNWSPPNEAGPSKSIWYGTYKKSISSSAQKALFKSFFTTSKVSVETVVELDTEQIKLEEDMRIAKELEFYKRKNVVEEATTSMSQEDEDIIEESPQAEPVSPVFKRNPFIKKRLSKFHCSNSDSQIIVKSRYFSQDCTNLQETVDKCETQEEIKSIEYSNESEENTEESDTVFELKEKEEITVDFSSEVNRDMLCDDVIEIDEQETDVHCKLEIEQFRKISPKKDNVGNTQKRKKIGSCRSVGLKRTRSEGATQQTLQQLLAKFKKK